MREAKQIFMRNDDACSCTAQHSQKNQAYFTESSFFYLGKKCAYKCKNMSSMFKNNEFRSEIILQTGKIKMKSLTTIGRITIVFSKSIATVASKLKKL